MDLETATSAANSAPTERHTDHMTMDDVLETSEKLATVLLRWKQANTAPSSIKQAPSFNASQLAELCGKSPDQMARLLEQADEKGLPSGAAPHVRGRPRVFTWAECWQWIRRVRQPYLRPEGKHGAVVSVGIFKGGVGKTVVTMALAQGLTMRGYKVLVVDCDPQGSLTSMLGVTPTDVPEELTAAPLTYIQKPDSERHASARDTLDASIRASYWAGIDLVPGNFALFQGEFLLPLRQMRARQYERDFRFYDVFAKALQPLRMDYDYILLDTPPALSYMTLAAHWAADALLMPVPPEGMDFTSAAEFLGMLEQVSSATTGAEKTFSWIRAVPSKVDKTKLHTHDILTLMKLGFGPLLSSVELPETAAVKVGAARLESVYDISKYVGDRRTLLRARAAYDALADEVDALTHKNVWSRAPA